MKTDAFFVERNPDHTDRAVWTRWKHVEIAAALAVFEHPFVVAKRRQLCDPAHFPFTNRRSRLRGTNCNRISSDQFYRLRKLRAYLSWCQFSRRPPVAQARPISPLSRELAYHFLDWP